MNPITVFDIPLNVASLTDREFECFCNANEGLRIQRNANKTLFVEPLFSLHLAVIQSDVQARLWIWNEKSKAGHVLGAGAGYYLPDGAMWMADTGFITAERFNKLTEAELQEVARIHPDFVVEFVRHGVSLENRIEKMGQWLNYGVSLGWLFDPFRRAVLIFRQGESEPKLIPAFDRTLIGTGVLEGFSLDLTRLAHILDR